MLTLLRRYRDFFVPFIGVLLVPFLTGATVFINPFMSFPAAGGSYLLEDNLEYADSTAAGVGGWTTVGAPTWAYATSPAPLQGSYSLFSPGSSNRAYHSFTAGATRYFYVIATVDSLTNSPYIIRVYNTTETNQVFAVRFLSAGAVRATNGTTDFSSGNGIVTAGTTYHLWGYYTAGTGANGTAGLYVSTTSTKPGSVTISGTTGNATLDAGSIVLTSGTTVNSIWDRVIVSSTDIGSAP